MSLGVLVFALAGNQGTYGPWLRALSLPVALITALALAWWLRGRERLSAAREREPSGPDIAPVPEAVRLAAEIQARRAGAFIDRVGDSARREELKRELGQIESARQGEVSSLHVVVFGTVSAGKTSLINALLGRQVGATEAVMGTTRHGENHIYELKSVDAAVSVTDTPGMGEAGQEGDAREAEARALAVRADLLLFVVDHDLIRGQYEPLIELARLGKRSILVLNKKDLFPDLDLAQILDKLRQRTAGVIDPSDIVAVAAAPRPVTVRTRRPDGTIETVLETEPPDISALQKRIAEVLRREGRLLHAANLLVRGRALEQEARDQVAAERERRALDIVEHYQWVTAGTVFANPIPALDVLAGGAVQFEMIGELGRVYEVNLNPSQVRLLAGQMVQSVLKLGLIETATSLIAGIFKGTLVGFAAGGAVQAVAMAYLTRVSGKAFLDYFRRGQAWEDGSIDAAVLRGFQETSRTEFLQDFAGQVVHRVLERLMRARGPEQAPAAPTAGKAKP
jgi:small GTP-binding protein